jgi:ketosteroid isomerase-like protein
MNTDQALRQLGRQWADAELRGDADTLDAITTDDFTLVGPLGFVLDKVAWLDRYRSGSLRFDLLSWEDVDIRAYGTAAICIGRQRQKADYQGHPNEGEFRVTQIAVERDGRWLLAGMHIGPLTTGR